VLTALDEAIGRVLTSLDELGLRENTVVMFVSDNGAFIKPGIGLEVQSNKPLRDGGVTTYEGGIRVPAIVRWPGRIEPGRVCGEMLSSLDLLPLMLGAAGGQLPPDELLDGLDPALALLGEAPSPHEALYWVWNQAKQQKWSAVRRGPYKLMRSADATPWELYDLRADIGETNNLAGTRPEVVNELAEKFAEWQTAASMKSTATGTVRD
jgi:arylsulfatase A-like enzyme